MAGRREKRPDFGAEGASTFGLERGELAAEISRCREAGWSNWEIRETFDLSALRDPDDAAGSPGSA